MAGISEKTAKIVAKDLVKMRSKHLRSNYYPLHVSLARIGKMVGVRKVEFSHLKIIDEALSEYELTVMECNGLMYIVSGPEFDLYSSLISNNSEMHLWLPFNSYV